MKDSIKKRLNFILLGSFLAGCVFFGAIFTVIYAFGKENNLGCYIVATIFQAASLALAALFMFSDGGLLQYWKQWNNTKAKATIFYPFVATIVVGVVSLFALIAGLAGQGWAVADGSSKLINLASYGMEFGFIAGVIPSLIMIPIFFDRNPGIQPQK